MSPDAPERIRQIEQALEEEPIDLATGSSVESIRGSTGSDMSRLPFLTVNDIIALRDADLEGLEAIENNILDVPDAAWEHVLFMVRARVVQVEPNELRQQIGEEA
ncbi:hypothetical protein BRD56_12880 [Thermoplasmatales archaeon SW_10_69_26]|nr:MAG: hypothetical protein BRD56_12880 [Thermoplasmatales archaeon SW_10_69_26]